MRRISFLLVITTVVLAAACGGDDADTANVIEPTPTETPQPTATPAPPERDFSAIAPIVEANLAEHDLEGAGLVIVTADEGIIHEAYWGPFGPDRISLIASSTKMITAGVLMHLDDRGLLDIDAPIADAVDWGSANPDITPAQLISNSSGLPGLLTNPAYPPYLCQFDHTQVLGACAEAIFTSADDDADVVAPDTEFRYGGGQWQVAGGIAEAVSGQSWNELIEEIYVEPCGLESLAYNNHFAQIPGGFSYPGGFDGDDAVTVR